jgi:uracil phosphoribosyltransferase
MENQLIEFEHPILRHKLGQLRDKEFSSSEFRRVVYELSMLMAFEITRDLTAVNSKVMAPLGEAEISQIIGYPIVVPIMRAGNGMLDGILSVLNHAEAGHIGIYRDKFINNTVEYYFRLPKNLQGREILLADPVLATADTAIACVDRLKQYEVGKIKVMSFLISKTGSEKFHHFHPDVTLYTIEVENEISKEGLLIPGIGDVGARLYQQ